MKAPRNILVPIDFSEAGAPAIDAAVCLAKHLDAKLTLLHVTFVPPTYTYADGLLWPTEAVRTGAQKDLERVAAEVRAQVPGVQMSLVPGDAAHEIVESAKSGGFDLVVMGTHGRRGISRLLLGSVADKVVRLCPVPVLTVPSPADAKLRKEVVR